MLLENDLPPPPSLRPKVFLGLWDTIASSFPSSCRKVNPCTNWCLAKTQAKRRWQSPGTIGASSHLMTWCVCAPQCPFLPMPISLSFLNCTLTLASLAWELFSTRLMMTELLPSLPMPVGVWQRLRPTTMPINWSFSPLSGPWSRNLKNICMDQLSTSISKTAPWHAF